MSNCATPSEPPRILFLNRSYWPDAEATGQLLTELCEDLAKTYDIEVIAGQPNQNPEGAAFRRTGVEVRNGVAIRRVRHTRFSKARLLGRALNYVTFLLAAAWAALRTRRPDVVVVETDPPLLCFVGRLLQKFRKTRLVVYLQDIYPDIAVALGKMPRWIPVRLLRRAMYSIYRRADRVVVLSRDMQDLLIRAGVPEERIRCIPNWTDTLLVHPRQSENRLRREWGVEDKFVVMYSGNMGYCQRLEDVIDAAAQLAPRDDIRFLLVGDGALKEKLRQQAAELGLTNVEFFPYRKKSDLAESLSAANVHLLPLDPRIASCLMPSKLYGVLASGSPLIAIARADCELVEIARRHGVGVVAPPGEPVALAATIEQLAGEPERLRQMGARARDLAEAQYDRRVVTPRFGAVLARVLGATLPATGRESEKAPDRLASQICQP